MNRLGRYKEVISLGGNCETAHQIRRFSARDKAYPFDWLITPFDSVSLLMKKGADLLFDLDNLFLGPYRVVVRCTATGIIHHHDFERDGEALVIRDAIPLQIANLKSKYKMLWDRLDSQCTSGDPVLFIRTWNEFLHYPDSAAKHCADTAYDFENFVGAIEDRYPKLDFDIAFVNYGASSRTTFGKAKFADIDYSDALYDWRGSDKGWDKFFTALYL